MQIIKLDASYAKAMVDILSLATDTDRAHFRPFDFAEQVIEAEIRRAKLDCFFGIALTRKDLAGFFMFRGMDEGFLSPMYGVYICPSYRGLGLGGLSIAYAKCLGYLSCWPSIKLKVDKDNDSAIRLYKRHGFVERLDKSGILVMECNLQ